MYGLESLLAGRTLVERYRVEAVIGRGGMGAVYRATDTRLGRDVAVKVISVPPADAQAHERLRARFLREARAAAGLHHPNIVQIYDFGTDPTLGLDFLVMELLRGEDLATRLSRKGHAAVPTALEVLYQAARGLAVGHRAGLIHRDVKPGNLFLEPGDRVGEVQVKVLDFGIAEIAGGDEQTVTHLTVSGRSPYSPAFASPEQQRGEAHLTPATDVFSLGAVGFQLLTGERAFHSADPREMVVELRGALARELPRVRGLPPAARAVLTRALDPETRQRFADAGALAEALAPLRAAPDATGTRGRDPAPRPRTEPAWTAAPETAPADDRTRLLTDLGAAPAPPPPHPARSRLSPPAPRPGRFRRLMQTAWSFCVSAVAIGLLLGAWLLVVTGLDTGELGQVYAGAAASVVLTPVALHRVMGSRGSFRFALLGSVAVSVAVAYLLHDTAEVEALLAIMFASQIAVAYLAERLTRAPDPAEPDQW